MKTFKSYSSAMPWVMTLVLSAVAAGCGGGGGQAPILGGAPSAGIAPMVTNVTPLPRAAGVPINTKILTATFSKAMDSATLNPASFTLACPNGTPITGVVSYAAAGNMATLTLPAANLPSSTSCTATLTTAVKDTSGVPLSSNFSWNFSTGTVASLSAPTVTSTINVNGATGVPINTSVGATFSEAMNPATLTPVTFTFKQGATAIPGTVSYSGVSAVFRPATLLASNTTYTATISTGATNVAGMAMAAPFTWSWTTGATADTTPPTVIGTIHANGAINVATNTTVGATFSEGLDPLTVTNQNFSLSTDNGTLVPGTVSYSGVNAVFIPLDNLAPATHYNVKVKGGASGVKDLAGNLMAADFTIGWTTAATLDTTAPTVLLVNPLDTATGVALNSPVSAEFNEAMDPLTINAANFTVGGVNGLVNFNALSRVATFTPSSNFNNSTTYTATIKGGINGVKDLAGNALTVDKVWSFTTAAIPPVTPPVIALATIATYGTFGGTAGMTNTGTLTVVNGDIGTIATGTSSITGFHDTLGDIYTETPANRGAVNGTIFTCTNSITGPTSAGPNATACAKATQARLDAQAAYLALAAMPPGANPGANLANLTLAPGVYTSPSGSFLIEGGNLTLDAQGNANAIFVFQMAQTLTVGGPGAAAPQSIILAGGAQAKNVFWQVGTFATINAAGGGTMAGTIIAQAGASFSTAGNVNIVTLNGRVISLGASVTLVNTVITVPAP